jgi:prefoldin subunit 5
MSGANLDGYNYAWKKSTLKSDLEKRVDKLEEGMRELVAVLALMNQTMDQLENQNDVER